MPWQESKAISCINVDMWPARFQHKPLCLLPSYADRKRIGAISEDFGIRSLRRVKAASLESLTSAAHEHDQTAKSKLDERIEQRYPKDPSRWSKQDVRLFKTAQYLPMSFHRLWSQFFVKCFGVCPRSSAIHTAEWWGKLWNKRASLCKCILLMHSS